MSTRPVWADIDLSAIRHNLNQVKKLIGNGKKIMAVVKANGYGHGSYEVGKTCIDEGADYLGVAILDEALYLRSQGLTCPIMVLGWIPPEHYREALVNEVIITIFDEKEASLLSQVAKELQTKARIHLKVDTGMTRLGIVANDTNVAKAIEIINLPHIQVEGIFTHLSKADEIDKTYSHQQIARFKDFVDKVEQGAGRNIPLKHGANSASIIDLPQAHFNLVRPGIMLYGLNPSPDVDLKKVDLRPALSLKARISRVEKYTTGTKVSYGGIYITSGDTLIATIPIGYADGYSRLLTGKGEVLIKDKKYPIVGRICMDQLMVDITGDRTIKQGDQVILIGRDKNFSISMDEIAYKLGTINYEVTCMLSSRVPRRYYDL